LFRAARIAENAKGIGIDHARVSVIKHDHRTGVATSNPREQNMIFRM